MYSEVYFLGLDVGTSGARVVAIDENRKMVAHGKSLMSDHGSNFRSPDIWWATASAALHEVLTKIDRNKVVAICVDGTSGTIIPTDVNGKVLADGLMYNDPCQDKNILELIARYAPLECAAHGATSGLAKALVFQQKNKPARVLHQADWFIGRLSGVFCSDHNNALKTGYDSIKDAWPEWISKTGLDVALLPKVYEPGTPVAEIRPSIAAEFGLPISVVVVSGTTDGCASFLATGVEDTGAGVTVLGTSLTIKMLSEIPIFDHKSGSYSHRILSKWLVGGSSNAGGNVLLHNFTRKELFELSQTIAPERPAGLSYYPLVEKGERFPVFDPELKPKMSPVPKDRAIFLQAIFEGIADVEAKAYEKIAELGGPKLRSVCSIGGGAENPIWMKIRQNRLGVNLYKAANAEAAYGTARLAWIGLKT